MPLEVRVRDPDGGETSLTPFYVRAFVWPSSEREGMGESVGDAPFELREVGGALDAVRGESVLPQVEGAVEAALVERVALVEGAGEAERLVETQKIGHETFGGSDVASLLPVVGQSAGEADVPTLVPVVGETMGERELVLLIPLTTLEAGGERDRFDATHLSREAEGHATTRHYFRHSSEDGASTVTQYDAGGGQDWVNIANAAGKTDGTLATIAGSLIEGRGGRLRLAYPSFGGLGSFTIRTVRLHFYVRQTGTTANTGHLELAARHLDGGTFISSLEKITGDVDNLVTPRTFDVTTFLDTWPKIEAASADVAFISKLGDTQTAACDAVHLEIIADRTI